MKFIFATRKISFDELQTECLKVCILDSIQNCENDISNFDSNSKEYAVLDNKKQLLVSIAKELDLFY